MSDILEIVVPEPAPLLTPTHWLIAESFRHLNETGEGAERAFSHAAELLRTREDAVKTLASLLRSAPAEDVGQRWAALYVLGEVGDRSAAGLLKDLALEDIPAEPEDQKCCEGPRDGEILLRTMAVEALQSVAQRVPEAAEAVIAVIEARPARPVLIEAVKAACALGLADKVAEILRKKDRWMLDIKRACARDIMADPERREDAGRIASPPAFQAKRERPMTQCCHPKKEG